MENKATKVKKKSFTDKCGENIFTCLEICMPLFNKPVFY